jgi:uncharacterized hydrophobic protein (TIGR00271 family)
MFGSLFSHVTENEKKDAIEGVIRHASPRPDFFLMMALSISMAVFGVILNSVIILIGSMLIAPLLYSLLSLALGIITADEKLVGRSFFTLLKSFVLAMAVGIVIGFFFAPRDSGFILAMSEIAGTQSSLGYAVVAVIAGFAAAFAMTKPHLNETLPGVAISVALIPPLAFAGVGLSLLNWPVVSNALLLFVVNIIGVVFSAMVVFSLFGFGAKRTVTREAVREEEKIVKEETEK